MTEPSRPGLAELRVMLDSLIDRAKDVEYSRYDEDYLTRLAAAREAIESWVSQRTLTEEDAAWGLAGWAEHNRPEAARDPYCACTKCEDFAVRLRQIAGLQGGQKE